MMRLAGWVAFLCVGSSTLAQGQDAAEPRSSRPFQLTGTLSGGAEAYSSTLVPGRRPAASAFTSADLGVSLYGIRSGLNLLLSTDESGLRQSINRVGYEGRWRFVGLQAGDVNPAYSPYSLNGVTVRGAGIELLPGPFVLSFLHGRSERATLPDTTALLSAASFDRTLDAVRVGAGARYGTHLHLIGLRIRDALPAGLPDSALRQPPKENLSLTPDIGLSLFGGAFRLQGTGTVSALTRDTRSTAISLEDVPIADLLNPLLEAKVGTRLDYAGEATAELRYRRAAATFGYERIQPGFESLGVPYLRSDQETLRLRPSIQVLGGRLLLDGGVSASRDNLAGDRLATERRTETALNAQTQLGRLTLAAALLRFTSGITPVSETAATLAPARSQTMHSLTITPALSLPFRSMTQLLSLSVTAQELADRSEGAALSPTIPGFQNVSSVLTYVLALPSGLSVNLSGTHLRADAGPMETRVSGLTAGVGHRLRAGALTVNATGGFSSTDITAPDATNASRQVRADASASYRLTPAQSLRFSVQGLSSTARSATAPGFRELRSELRYEHALAQR